MPKSGSRLRALNLALLAGSLLAVAGVAAAQDAPPPTAPAPASTASSTDDSSSSVEASRNSSGDLVVTAAHYVPIGAVTATKSSIPLIQTPQSVSVITRDQIDLLNFVDAQQAVRYTAGVFGENYGPDLRFDFFTVRGFTPKQYIDGLAAPISTTIYSVGVDLYAFQSLELLKGPASVLYGNAPPGGIFNETSRRAADQLGGEFNVKYGSDDYLEFSSTVTGPIAHGLDARLTGLYLDRDAEVDNVHANRLLLSPTFTWHVDDNTQLTGLFYYQYDKVKGGESGFLPVQGTLLPNPNGQIPRTTNLDDPSDLYIRHQSGVGYDFSHAFSPDLSFHSNTKYSHYHEETPIGVYDSGGLINTTDPTQPSYYRTALLSNFTYAEKVESFATDNRIDATVDSGPVRQKILVGVDYRHVKNDADYGFDYGTSTVDVYDPVFTPLANPDFGYPTRYNHQTLNQTGLYGQDQFKVGDLYLLAGGRYDWASSSYLDPFTPVSAPAGTNHQSADKFTYRLGASYVTDSGIAPYVSYATSFEPVIGSDATTGKAFVPSDGHQIEGGVKYDARGLPSDIKLFATAAVFDIRQTNVVSTTPSVSPVFGSQSGEVEVYGGELEFVGRFHNQLSINGSWSYNHSEVLQSNTPQEIGQPLPVTPKYKASLFADYTFQKGMLGGFGFGGGVRYTSSSAGSLPGPFNLIVYDGQAATLFDAIVHYDAPHFRIAINGSNIFDKDYVARCSGPAGCVYGAGRQVIATVTARF